MAAPSTEEIAQVQAKILEIGTRLQSGATFKTLFATDPVATLRAQGLPDAAIQEIKAQATRARDADANEVSGYDKDRVPAQYYIDAFSGDNWFQTTGSDDDVNWA